MAQPWLKYQVPSTPGPVTIGQADPYKPRDQQLQEEANARAREADARAREAAARSATEWNATHNPDGTPKAVAKQEKLPLGMSNAIQENLKSLQQVEESLKELESRPQSIGPGTGMLGDTFTQWNDPQGTDVRAKVGNIGATKIHDLSGAAVSASEAPRFQPFVPTVTDMPEVAKRKLTNFRDQLRSQLKEQLDYTRDPKNGYLPYSTPSAENFLKSLTADTTDEKPNTATIGPPTTTEGHFGDERGPTPNPPHAEDFRSGLYKAMRSGQIASTADMAAWVQQFNQANKTDFHPQLTAKETERAIEAAKQGKAFNVELPKYTPDITDVRGGANTSTQDAINAGVRGIVDVPTFGAVDKIVAGADTLFKGGTMDENLARQYAISDYDTANHPYARLAGQALGGTLLPLGDVSTLPLLAGKGAAIGGAYGAGSSRSLSDIPVNALSGAAAGAAVPSAIVGAGRGLGAIGGAFRRGTANVPPLVNPDTGRLNQVLDTMPPAQRVQAMQDVGLTQITPGMAGGRSARVIEQGLNNLPGSAGVMEDVNSNVTRELDAAARGVADRFGASRTFNEGGAELQRGAQQWMERFDRVTNRAYNAIPIAKDAPASNNTTLETLKQLTDKLPSNPLLAEEIKDPVLGRYLIAIQEKGLTWNDTKDFRTYIGKKIGQFRFSEDARTGDYRSLYAALSEDMRNTAAAQGPKALRAFERANAIKAQGEQRIDDALVRILGPDAKGSPEKAAAAVQAMTKGGKSTGDLRTLAQIKASTVKSGAWDEIASTLISLGGQPSGAEGRMFNPKTFTDWYEGMTEPARRMLFKPDQRKALDNFVAVAQQVQRVKGLTNTSNTTPTMIGSGVVGASGVLAIANPLALLLPIGGGFANLGMAKLWTSPAALRILTGYVRAQGNEPAIKSQIGRLTKLATTNPELRAPIQAMLAHLNDNAPKVGAVAASPDQGPQDQTQPQ